MRFLFWIAMFVVGYLLFRPKTRPGNARPDARQRTSQSERVIPCSVCQVHIPESEALVDRQGRQYCCAAHRQQGEGRP